MRQLSIATLYMLLYCMFSNGMEHTITLPTKNMYKISHELDYPLCEWLYTNRDQEDFFTLFPSTKRSLSLPILLTPDVITQAYQVFKTSREMRTRNISALKKIFNIADQDKADPIQVAHCYKRLKDRLNYGSLKEVKSIQQEFPYISIPALLACRPINYSGVHDLTPEDSEKARFIAEVEIKLPYTHIPDSLQTHIISFGDKYYKVTARNQKPLAQELVADDTVLAGERAVYKKDHFLNGVFVVGAMYVAHKYLPNTKTKQVVFGAASLFTLYNLGYYIHNLDTPKNEIVRKAIWALKEAQKQPSGRIIFERKPGRFEQWNSQIRTSMSNLWRRRQRTNHNNENEEA